MRVCCTSHDAQLSLANLLWNGTLAVEPLRKLVFNLEEDRRIQNELAIRRGAQIA
jgi:hypothetical protein